MKREFLLNFKVGDQPLPKEVIDAIFHIEKDRGTQRIPRSFGPSVEIRTRGLLNPIQARYQTSPHPDVVDVSRQLQYNSTLWLKMQVLFFAFLIFLDLLLYMS